MIGAKLSTEYGLKIRPPIHLSTRPVSSVSRTRSASHQMLKLTFGWKKPSKSPVQLYRFVCVDHTSTPRKFASTSPAFPRPTSTMPDEYHFLSILPVLASYSAVAINDGLSC